MPTRQGLFGAGPGRSAFPDQSKQGQAKTGGMTFFSKGLWPQGEVINLEQEGIEFPPQSSLPILGNPSQPFAIATSDRCLGHSACQKSH